MAQFGYNAATGAYTGNGIDVWTEMDRPFEFKLQRASGATPGSVEIIFPGVNTGSDNTPPLWMFQRIKIMEEDASLGLSNNEGRMFIGRVDIVTPRQTARYGRIWVVKARDYLAALVDNYVDVGKQRAYSGATLLVANNGVGKPRWEPRWIEKDQIADQGTPLPGDGSCSDAGEACGADRKVMIAELALNIVPLPFGISQVNFISPPNSLPVSETFDGVRSLRILSAINKLAREDPWDGGEAPSGFVDSQTATGIGGEFQIQYSQPDSDASPWAGQQAQYFRRLQFPWSSTIEFKYGVATATSIPILSYDFPQEGSDIYSRAMIIGRGDAQDLDPGVDPPTPLSGPGGSGAGWGRGLVLDDPQLEGTWDPSAGKFAIMRGMEAQDAAVVGSWSVDPADQPDGSPNPLEMRGMRDAAAAQLIMKTSGVSKRGENRGLRGVIRVPGYPRGVNGAGPTIGLHIDVTIPPALGDASIQFVIESFKFSYPENVTTIQLAIRSGVSLAQVMGGWMNRQDQGEALLSEWKTDGWGPTQGTGLVTYAHRMGVIPRTVIVEVARQDGSKLDHEGKAIPLKNTIVEVPRLANEPAQGQNFGYVVHKSNAIEFNIGLAYWTADSSGAGGFLKDGASIIRVRLRA